MNAGPIRILYVHNSADLYGASRSLLRLLKKLDRSRFTPIVLLPGHGPLLPLLQETGAECVIQKRLSIVERSSLRPKKLFGFVFNFPISVIEVMRLIRRRRVHLVHTNTGVIVSSALAARLCRVPHIWHIRDWFQEFRSVWRIYSFYIRWSSRWVIPVSNAVAGQFPAEKKIRVIFNGFSLDEFKVGSDAGVNFRTAYHLDAQFVAGAVGRIKWMRKGQEILVQALALLKKRGRRLRVVVVGSVFPGNEQHYRDLQKIIRDLDLEKEVVFTGELADPKPAFAAMDVLVLPSAQPEPFGGVVMEAMAMGVPVVATNIGGSIDQVADGVTGFLIAPGDPELLADKIAWLMDHPERGREMGEAGRARLAAHFSLDEMSAKIQSLYQATIDAAGTECDK